VLIVEKPLTLWSLLLLLDRATTRLALSAAFTITVNLKNFVGVDGKVFCTTHAPKPKNTQVTETVTMKTAMSAPRKDHGIRGIHKADPKVAPARSGDFTVNQVGDQSTENNPESSAITYDAHHGDQSTENNPESSSIAYDAYSADQSTENDPEASGVSYETYDADQSRE